MNQPKTTPNDAQLAAIRHTEGPLLIIAGPGSGKTKTLVDRIVHIIGEGTTAENIMVATFTEKAADELITRVHQLAVASKMTYQMIKGSEAMNGVGIA